MVYCRACGNQHQARPRSPEAVTVGVEADAAATRRPYENPPAWQVAGVLSLMAAGFAGLLYVHPGFVRLPLPGGISLPISLAVPLVSFAAMGWAIGGFREKGHVRRPLWCVGSLVVSTLAIVAAWIAFYKETFGV